MIYNCLFCGTKKVGHEIYSCFHGGHEFTNFGQYSLERVLINQDKFSLQDLKVISIGWFNINNNQKEIFLKNAIIVKVEAYTLVMN